MRVVEGMFAGWCWCLFELTGAGFLREKYCWLVGLGWLKSTSEQAASVLLFHHAHVKSIDPSIVVAVVVDPAGDVRYVRTYSNVTLARCSLQRGLLVTMETRFWSHMHVLNGSSSPVQVSSQS